MGEPTGSGAHFTLRSKSRGAALTVSDPDNRTWRVEGSADGLSWRDLGEANVRNTGLEIAINLRPPLERRFFRLRESLGGEMSAAVVLRPLSSPYSFAERAVVPRHLGRNVSRVVIDDHAAALGRVLFYDRRLSANQAVSCATCHQQERCHVEPTSTFLSNGLDLETGGPGRGAVTGREEDMGTFRPPTLRNIAVTAPYMHDGRFATLRQTLEFYDRGIQDHPNLSILPAGGIGFREGEIEDLEAFLNALTDEGALVDEALSDPFVKDVELSE